MVKVKGEPGVYIPLDKVIEKLREPAYGAADLVKMGLFHSEHFIRDAMYCGKIKFHKINKRAVYLCRDDIIEYWKKYRNTPYEPAVNTLTVKFAISEVDYITNLINHGKNRVHRDFNKDDLFRNVVHFLHKTGIDAASFPELFAKRF